jgi:hypothetical protein
MDPGPKERAYGASFWRERAPDKRHPSEEHKAVLLVTIGYRRKRGVSRTRVGEILGLDASGYLEDLRRLELVYAEPSRELNFWRPTQSALLALGFTSFTEIPALKELEEWFDAQQKEIPRDTWKLDPFFEKTSKLASRRRAREVERRETIASPVPRLPRPE